MVLNKISALSPVCALAWILQVLTENDSKVIYTIQIIGMIDSEFIDGAMVDFEKLKNRIFWKR